jgi:hypothetical protein
LKATLFKNLLLPDNPWKNAEVCLPQICKERGGLLTPICKERGGLLTPISCIRQFSISLAQCALLQFLHNIYHREEKLCRAIISVRRGTSRSQLAGIVAIERRPRLVVHVSVRHHGGVTD